MALRWLGLIGLTLLIGLPTEIASAQSAPPPLSRQDFETFQRIDAENAKREAATMSAILAESNADSARMAYDKGEWTKALASARKGCDGNVALGCDILGRLLAEGRIGPAEPGSALATHRKAASLYAKSCPPGSLSSQSCGNAGDFMSSFAVPGVRNPGLAQAYYTRARDGYAYGCNQFDAADSCFMAGGMSYESFTGRPDPVAAVRFWRRGCDEIPESKSFTSCDRLALELATGPMAIRDPAEARRRITADQCSVAEPAGKKSLRGDREFCAVLGDLLLDGQGGPADPRKGEQLLRAACGLEQDSACQSLTRRGLGLDDIKGAQALLTLGFATSARKAFETQCTANNGLACNEAGRLYNQDSGAPEKTKARQLFARSCALNYAIGCYNSGNSLRNLGGEANFMAARAALGKACDAKDAQSCRLLGVMFGRGEGGQRDPVEASRLYELACTARDSAACLNLGTNYLNGTGVAADPVRARTLHEQACSLGSLAGCNAFAEALTRGRGGARDDVRARDLLQRACDGNIASACGNLGGFWRDGLGGGSDHALARSLFEKGCRLRNASACADYSDSLLSSRGGPTDQTKAILYRQFACFVLDDSPACQWLKDGGHGNPLAEGNLLLNNNRLDRALPRWRQACDAGQAEGCLNFAAYLDNPAKDAAREAERTTFYRKACALGSEVACDRLAK